MAQIQADGSVSSLEVQVSPLVFKGPASQILFSVVSPAGPPRKLSLPELEQSSMT